MKTHLLLACLLAAMPVAAEVRYNPDSTEEQNAGPAVPYAVYFYTAAPEISVRCTGSEPVTFYRIDSCGQRMECAANVTGTDTLEYRYTGFPADSFHNLGAEYRIYMPDAGRADNVEIAVPDGNEVTFISRSPERPFAVSADPATAIALQKEFDIRFDNSGAPVAAYIDVAGMTVDEACEKTRGILRIPDGVLRTQIPVTQRREPANYEWQQRHRDIVGNISAAKPEAVIIGNSIVHYWGGVPGCWSVNGAESWSQYMETAGFFNLGCGWDRIENMLWRICHGELDGFSTGRIVLLAGTNNMGLDSDTDIAEGVRSLIQAIRIRQTGAEITVAGILPRRDGEEWTRNVNGCLARIAVEEDCGFIDPGKLLLGADGKIDESLFKDGLHPNEQGYMLIAPEISGAQ